MWHVCLLFVLLYVLLEEQPSRAASDAVYLTGLWIPQFEGGCDNTV